MSAQPDTPSGPADSGHALLAPFLEARVIAPLDFRFALALARMARPQPPPEVILGAAAASAALTRGDICLELSRAKDLLVPIDEAARLDPAITWPAPAPWRAALTAASPIVSDGTAPTPLVLDGDRLYLHRYWDYQRRLSAALAARRTLTFEVDESRLGATLDRLFFATSPGARAAVLTPDPAQRQAAETAVRRGLTIISGGPGTGKTSTVVRILAALIEELPELRVALLAPTGKAATRLSASIREQKLGLDLDPHLRDAIPENASTIHRRLGFNPQNPTRFLHDASFPLPVDVVVLDEASMVDLSLMTKLVEAVPPSARFILLGDKDQLASVAAGHVLGDIAEVAAPREPLADSFVQLTQSHRFARRGGIGVLADAIREGNPDRVVALLKAGLPDVTWIEPDASRLEELVITGLAPLFSHLGTPADALQALPRFQLLTAHRRGPFGAETLNAQIARWLVRHQVVPAGNEWHPGLPIIVTVNDHAQDLFNGDTGVTLLDPDGTLRVHFPTAAIAHRVTATRAVALAQLPSHAPLYAMTIHKAQGSGFDHVLVALPPEPSPVTTRELLYTAVTRARDRVTLMCTEAVLRHATATRVQRASGLPDALRQAAASPPPDHRTGGPQS